MSHPCRPPILDDTRDAQDVPHDSRPAWSIGAMWVCECGSEFRVVPLPGHLMTWQQVHPAGLPMGYANGN